MAIIEGELMDRNKEKSAEAENESMIITPHDLVSFHPINTFQLYELGKAQNFIAAVDL